MQLASTASAIAAFDSVKYLQQYFANSLNQLDTSHELFEEITWLRDNGMFGGGSRLSAIEDQSLINRASINISQVQYESDPSKGLSSATALSTIIHPAHPLLPSIHMHISWTEMKNKNGYWRIMADLNPSHPDENETREFLDILKRASPSELLENALLEGDRYFFIPALDRHRGVAHYYIENFNTGSLEDDNAFARKFGKTLIDGYLSILKGKLAGLKPATENQIQEQLRYHSLYFLQVLTLDRGTTSGILVHDQNDLGILASLPAKISTSLIQEWKPRHSSTQQLLIDSILDSLDNGEVVTVTNSCKLKIAACQREFYRLHPEAQDLLARGSIIPPTVSNHEAKSN